VPDAAARIGSGSRHGSGPGSRHGPGPGSGHLVPAPVTSRRRRRPARWPGRWP
jgi:hypothetical protein